MCEAGGVNRGGDDMEKLSMALVAALSWRSQRDSSVRRLNDTSQTAAVNLGQVAMSFGSKVCTATGRLSRADGMRRPLSSPMSPANASTLKAQSMWVYTSSPSTGPTFNPNSSSISVSAKNSVWSSSIVGTARARGGHFV